MYNTAVPDVVPVFDETFKLCPDGTGVLTVQVYQVEVVGVVNCLNSADVADENKCIRHAQ